VAAALVWFKPMTGAIRLKFDDKTPAYGVPEIQAHSASFRYVLHEC
jgi:hypothetical protein